MDRTPVDAEAGRHAGRVILDQHVRPGDQLGERLLSGG